MADQPRDPSTARFTSSLTPEVQQLVVDALLGGAPPEVACSYAGIQRSTYYEWLKRGRRAISEANGNADAIVQTDPYAGFVAAVDHALARFITGNLAAIGTAGRVETGGQWQALAWQLERRFPAFFGRKTRHEITGKDGGPVDIAHAIVLDPAALDSLPLERKLVLAEILAEMDGEVIDAEPLLELEA